jgi:hypothetical protein
MKLINRIPAIAPLGFLLALQTSILAQAQTVTLVATNNLPASYDFSTNQVVTINSFVSANLNAGVATISFANGLSINLRSYPYPYMTYSQNNNSYVAFTGSSAVFTGVTNISMVSGLGAAGTSALTFTITTPTVQSTVPANAVVIPTDATGPVQIVLESSADLVNWTSALPGTYGTSTTNRFFRVRAVASP